MTSRLRELIQQLGEAIHESVIESEQIAGVVQDIRQYGFDVLLMLEATIGLNEVAVKEAEDAEARKEEGVEEAAIHPERSALSPLPAHLGRRGVEGRRRGASNRVARAQRTLCSCIERGVFLSVRWQMSLAFPVGGRLNPDSDLAFPCNRANFHGPWKPL